MGTMLKSFIKEAVDKKTKLHEITPNMIKDGILIIPEGIISINTNINTLFEIAHLNSSQIKVVIFPKTLQTIDNFFYNNKDVQLVIFNSPVALTSRHNQGTFENSNVKEIIIPHGFTRVDYKPFMGNVLGKLVVYGETPMVCPSFFNSSIEYITTVLERYHSTGITKIEKSYLSDDSNISWKEVTMLMHRTNNLKIRTIPINQDYVLQEDFEALKERAISDYVETKTFSLKSGSKSSTLDHDAPINIGFATN